MEPVPVTKPTHAHHTVKQTDKPETTHPDHIDPAAYDALQRMVQQHREYDQQLNALLAQPTHSDADKQEAARLKKLKLRKKDEIEHLRHEMHLYMGQHLEH
jgi:hypothetical protein